MAEQRSSSSNHGGTRLTDRLSASRNTSSVAPRPTIPTNCVRLETSISEKGQYMASNKGARLSSTSSEKTDPFAWSDVKDHSSLRKTYSGSYASTERSGSSGGSSRVKSHTQNSNSKYPAPPTAGPGAAAAVGNAFTARPLSNGTGLVHERRDAINQCTRQNSQAPLSYLLSATRSRESLLIPGEGRAYHLAVQQGELHNRILTVGHPGRADWIAERFLDHQMRILSLKNSRNFRVHSGYYKGKQISIVAVGMGSPMIEVLVREASYITQGPLAIVRLGTCTLIDPELRPGSIVVANPGSLGCYTNYAYFDGTAAEYSSAKDLKPYIITRPCAADPELTRLIYRHAISQDPSCVFEGLVPIGYVTKCYVLLDTRSQPGLNVSAETFYSCQGREDRLFRVTRALLCVSCQLMATSKYSHLVPIQDENSDLLESLIQCGAQTLDMETHQLFHLASRRKELMKAAAVHIGVTNRTNDHYMHPITPPALNSQLAIAAKAAMDALVDVMI